MTISNNGIIHVNRGDSFVLNFNINVGNSLSPEYHIMGPQDVIYVGVMEPNQPFECAIIRKKFTYEDFLAQGASSIYFRPEDTQCLLPGKYYYQIKWEHQDTVFNRTNVTTIVDKTLFYILE